VNPIPRTPLRLGRRMAVLIALVAASAVPLTAAAQSAGPPVRVVTDAAGSRLQVDGRDFMVFGMNWDYVPIGQNYLYDLWSQPDDFIRTVLDREMPLLQGMGVNVIRHYVGIPPRWVRYIYERYGIWTVVNHPMARYGFTVNGVWVAQADYGDPQLRAAVKADVLAMVDSFRDTPGMLMWLLGNENNYGLSWTSFEAEALPEGERDAARARQLYSLFGEVTREVKARDPGRPVAIANGDVQYLDIVAEQCRDLDVFGTNVYRGISARDLFDVVKDKLGVPVMFTEFGADAWNAREMHEDQATQARYLIGQWEEIYEQSSGKGRTGNAIGGFVFQWADGWWKFGQESRLDVHDTNASWPNGGYPEDFVEGDNNMNEEWWGICAKGRPDSRGLYELYPRAAYYALRRAFTLAPYAPGTDLTTIRNHFANVTPATSVLEARGDRASLLAETTSRVRVSSLRLEFETISTGGRRVSTPEASEPRTSPARIPLFKGFDHMQSFYAGFEAHPSENVSGSLTLNVLGHVPLNPIDEIFYENRGRPRNVAEFTGPPKAPTGVTNLELNDIERVKVYRAGVSWDDRWFLLDGFYRTGHFHWGYEGDFFGLYREANYGENIDIYKGEAPVGVELAGKRWLNGLKFAIGPQLWWGANPAVLMKYARPVGPVTATAVYQADLTSQGSVNISSAVPVPPTSKVTLHLATSEGPFGFEVGGIWAGNNRLGDPFRVPRGLPGNYEVWYDRLRSGDDFGIKGKITWEDGPWHWYAQAATMGLVADGGPTATTTYTGWHLKDSGSGNQRNFLTGLAYNVGDFQIAPNFLWQEPHVDPMPNELTSSGESLLRNILRDPFAVRSNREQVGTELLITYDPTPATWMWQWDNDVREDAHFAASIGFVHRQYRTSMDAGIGILEDGVTAFAFPLSTPPRDVWDLHARVVSAPRPGLRIVAHAFTGTGEPNGNDPRLVGGKGARRFGGDARVVWDTWSLSTFAKVNDWGPYDYHRDFNFTFPLQLMGDLSYTLGAPMWFETDHPQTRIGVRGMWRSLDRYSPRYAPGAAVDENGNEWEVRTYLQFAI